MNFSIGKIFPSELTPGKKSFGVPAQRIPSAVVNSPTFSPCSIFSKASMAWT